MAALQFQRDGDTITITDDRGSEQCTIAELHEAVATWGTCYGELTEPLTTLEYSLQYSCLNCNPPIKVAADDKANRVYWFTGVALRFWGYEARHTIYDFVESEGLFPITRRTPHIDVTAIQARWMAEIPQADCVAQRDAMAALDATLVATDFSSEESRRALCFAIFGSCMTRIMAHPICNWIWEHAATDYGICSPSVQDQCVLCPFYSVCWDSNGSVNLYKQLAVACRSADVTPNDLEQLRSAILVAQSARDVITSTIIEVV